MQHVHQAAGTARHRLKALNAGELALVGPLAFKLAPPDDLHGAQRAHDIAREPYFPVSPAPDGPEQRVIGNCGWSAHHSSSSSFSSSSSKTHADQIENEDDDEDEE